MPATTDPTAFRFTNTPNEHQRTRQKNFITYLLLTIVLVGCASYFYQARQNPPGFYLDESSISYNAYTIAETGRDEYGESWPLYFRAFGEYKNPVYIYLLALLFRIFGPSILVARLLSVSLGVTAIVVLSFLAFQISRKLLIAATVGFSAMLTPWLFENSRLVFEVALYPLLVCLFLLAVFRASQKTRWGWQEILSVAATLSLLFYSYSIGRLLAPLLAVGLAFFITRRRLRGLVTTWLVFAFTLIPALIFNLRHPGAMMSRFWLITYISPDRSIREIVVQFLGHYLANINPWTIAVTGETNVRDHLGTMGSVLAPTLLVSLLGIGVVLIYLRNAPWWRFMLYALLVSVIPASLTTTEFPQIRLIAMPIILHVFMISGLLCFTAPTPSPTWFSSLRYPLFALVLLTILVQGLIFRLEFTQAGPGRWYIFDDKFPREVLPTALAQNKRPIYFYDPPGKSGYVQAYWHGMLQGLPATEFVRVTEERQPRDGDVVISTAEECSNCQMLLKSINYIVYIVRPPEGPSTQR